MGEPGLITGVITAGSSDGDAWAVVAIRCCLLKEDGTEGKLLGGEGETRRNEITSRAVRPFVQRTKGRRSMWCPPMDQ